MMSRSVAVACLLILKVIKNEKTLHFDNVHFINELKYIYGI